MSETNGPPAYPMIEMRKRLMWAEGEVERLREENAALQEALHTVMMERAEIALRRTRMRFADV